MMKRHNFTVLLLAALLFCPPAHAAKPAPDFSLPGTQGEVSLAELHGQVVYLDFWASWCTPCRQSFPWMDAMQTKYGSRGLQVIAVNLDKEAAKRDEFLTATNPHFTIAYDPEGGVAENYEVMGMPSSYLIGRDGNIHYNHIGFREKDQGKLEQQILELLSVPQESAQ